MSAPNTTQPREHRFLSFDGTPILYRRYDPDHPRPSALVLIIHGMGEHGGRYDELATFLSGRGIACLVPDLRGFGLSGGKRGCLRNYEDHFEDIKILLRLLQKISPGSPCFLLGHSFGGLIAASFASKNGRIPLAGVVLSSPNFGIGFKVPRAKTLLARILSLLAPDFTQESGVATGFLTHDAEIQKRYSQDKLIHHRISARLYVELMRLLSEGRNVASSLRSPVLVLQAGDDRVVSRAATEGFFKDLAATDKRLQILEGRYHEILNETDRMATFLQIADWVLSRAQNKLN